MSELGAWCFDVELFMLMFVLQKDGLLMESYWFFYVYVFAFSLLHFPTNLKFGDKFRYGVNLKIEVHEREKTICMCLD